ncbi:hypothetical protein CFP56_006212 [Quercus suber]|uniref:Uncharacterized protein n=1 Tax=Quercus suber TaxID=58331 RepID=A0AAW0L8V7_QUESU
MKLHFCYMGCLENDMHAFQFNIPCCLDFIVSCKDLTDLQSINVNAMKLHFCYMGCLENDMHAFQFNIPCCLDFIVS